MLKLIIRAAIVAIDMGETHSAYLLLIKALGIATKQGKPTGYLSRSLVRAYFLAIFAPLTHRTVLSSPNK